MKKIIALLLAALMAFGMCTTAMAAEVKGSITITDATHVSVAGKTFNAYKVLDAKMVDTSNIEKGIAYTVPAQLSEFYAGRYELSAESATFDEDVAAQVALEEDMFAFAADVLAAAKKAGISPKSAAAGDEDASVTISGLDLGYYVIEDTGANTPVSALMLDTTTPNVSIEMKADKPSIDKKIDGNTDTDPSTEGKVEMNNAAMGDKVPFIVTSAVPDMTGYSKYFFVVNDTLSKGLSFDAESDEMTITIGGESLRKGEDFTVSSEVVESGETQVKIVFKNFIQYAEQAGDPIVIKYAATVDTDAVIGIKGNPNKVNLEFSHNPNIVPQGQDEPTPGDKEKDVTGKTPDSVTRTFVTALEITKVDSQGNRLVGAEFELKGTRLNTVLVKKDMFTVSPEGTWYKLADGTYTEVAPQDNEEDYDHPETMYALESRVETITKEEEVQYKGVVGSDGVLRFEGLAAGQYTITELKAPDGYNMIKEPIQVTINCQLPEDVNGTCTWSASEPATSDNNIIRLSVENKTGTELPSTGGIGTTIFYVVGGLLVVGAAVLLITRKRSESRK